MAPPRKRKQQSFTRSSTAYNLEFGNDTADV